MGRLSLLGAALLALLGAASANAATITVGSPLTASFTPAAGSAATNLPSVLPESGAHVLSPASGTVVRWRITQASGGPFKLRVLTFAGGTYYTGAGSSVPETPASTATETYVTSMPIHAGQTIGLDCLSSCQFGVAPVGGASLMFWVPPLPDGSTRAADGTASGEELGFNADVRPLPSISSISPSSGSTSGGTTVMITGQNFEGTTGVSFGSTPAASFTVLSDNVVTAITPASSAGTVDVTVINPGQSQALLADRFAYVASPTVKCVVPKLKGKTLKAARKALKRAHCKLGKVKGAKGKNARVKNQKPKPGKVLKAGSKVRVTTKRLR